MIRDAEARTEVIKEAETWLHTPYHHKGRVKGTQGGVDCAMLLAEVYAKCGVIKPLEDVEYPPDWMLHRGLERYMEAVTDMCYEVPKPGTGDIVLYRVGRCFAHGGIVIRWPLIIHAFSRERKVCYGEGDSGWLAGRDRHYFTPWRIG